MDDFWTTLSPEIGVSMEQINIFVISGSENLMHKTVKWASFQWKYAKVLYRLFMFR
jgi:hypothetical protein